MVQKAHLQTNLLIWAIACCCMTISSCQHIQLETHDPASVVKDYTIDNANIPYDTLLISDKKISLNNGIYFAENKKYSGIIKELYTDGKVKTYSSIFQGKLHGLYKSFYPDGSPFEVRQYKNNLSTGRHYGYWPAGHKLKFDYNYFEEKREGLQKKWYKNGKPYLFANFKNDHEEGLQQGWRENGKLFLNYVVKDGHSYGLQQSALCYTLIDQEMKSR